LKDIFLFLRLIIRETSSIRDLEYTLIKVKGKFAEKPLFISRANNLEVGYIYLREFTIEGDNPRTLLINMGWIPKRLKEQFMNENVKDQNEIIGLLKRSEKNNLSKEQMALEKDLDGMYHIDLDLLSDHTQNVIDKRIFIGKILKFIKILFDIDLKKNLIMTKF
jgi:cytochrome oxidase assembly protein ShyY1